MKRNILIVFALLLTASVNAQEVTISNGNITEKDNCVTVSFTATLDKLSSNERLTITPVLYSESGTQSLKPIVVVGRGRAISDKRIGQSQGVRYVKGEIIPYTITLPYEAWMGEVSLRIDRKVASCCEEKQLASHTAIDPKLIHYDVEPNYSLEKEVKALTELEKYDNESAFLYPISNYTSKYESMRTMREGGALKIYFKQGSSVIDPKFSGNDNILSQLRKVMALIQVDSTAALEKIVLLGLASPEGNISQNTKLAAERAKSLKNYFSGNLQIADSIIEIIPADEDWDGLVKLVEASDMEYKQEVLDIIEKYDIHDGREMHLMNLKWGRPYNYMLKHFFPQLRNAGYVQIYYESKPDIMVVQFNQALDMINNKQYGDALKILGTLKDDARVCNLKGIALMMMGDYVQSERCFQNAIEQGSSDAVRNLEQLRIKQTIK